LNSSISQKEFGATLLGTDTPQTQHHTVPSPKQQSGAFVRRRLGDAIADALKLRAEGAHRQQTKLFSAVQTDYTKQSLDYRGTASKKLQF
jgi:hypothetical protein